MTDEEILIGHHQTAMKIACNMPASRWAANRILDLAREYVEKTTLEPTQDEWRPAAKS